ncbi:helix-turn-helix domain-containing protein [Undibacterium curvum]|uniref:helix-turn-helix domain-containing protein n=1 Tax=Undibacterium curvum TaxID=2762294 RepID=UPI003D12A311
MAGKFSKITHFPTPKVSSARELGQWIRARRVAAGIRIDDAAALCNVSVQLLSDLENGNRSVGIDKVFAVINCLGLDLIIKQRGEDLDIRDEEAEADDAAKN